MFKTHVFPTLFLLALMLYSEKEPKCISLFSLFTLVSVDREKSVLYPVSMYHRCYGEKKVGFWSRYGLMWYRFIRIRYRFMWCRYRFVGCGTGS